MGLALVAAVERASGKEGEGPPKLPLGLVTNAQQKGGGGGGGGLSNARRAGPEGVRLCLVRASVLACRSKWITRSPEGKLNIFEHLRIFVNIFEHSAS